MQDQGQEDYGQNMSVVAIFSNTWQNSYKVQVQKYIFFIYYFAEALISPWSIHNELQILYTYIIFMEKQLNLIGSQFRKYRPHCAIWNVSFRQAMSSCRWASVAFVCVLVSFQLLPVGEMNPGESHCLWSQPHHHLQNVCGEQLPTWKYIRSIDQDLLSCKEK